MKKHAVDYDNYTGAIQTYWWDDAQKQMVIHNHYDCTSIIESNKRRMNASLDKRFGGEMLHHFAEIPLGVVAKWKDEGIDVFSADPEMKKKVKQKLYDPEYRYLRTTVKRV